MQSAFKATPHTLPSTRTMRQAIVLALVASVAASPSENCQDGMCSSGDEASALLQVKTESQTSLQEKSEQKSQPPPVDACGYECKSWIHDDDCKAQDDAAKTCR